MNDGCAPAGRHGRAHRHRPYQTPSYFATQSHTNKITIYTQSIQTASTVPRAIHPNETVGAVPMCPPERPRSGVSIPKTHAWCAGNERWMRPCGATRAGTQAPPLPISIKPHGMPLAHRGYTFDSAGLASATQPTLGNNASEEATPLGVVLFPPHCFLISTHNTSGAEMHRALPPPFFKTNCVYANWHRDDAHLF